MTIVALCALALTTGIWMLLSALNENTQFFYNPSVVTAGDFAPESETYRVGGLVVEGSVVRGEDLLIRFSVENFENGAGERLPVSYTGIIPSLFREGQGVVISGRLNPSGEFIATELLAKHDENYRPKMASTYE